mmetsp:Transcript_85368/g.194664  ORF Transcript_85368/g.194664 Transcript_85368/m.194664 type:complete len:251 (+) Transcript_85368:1911-2663(+)
MVRETFHILSSVDPLRPIHSIITPGLLELVPRHAGQLACRRRWLVIHCCQLNSGGGSQVRHRDHPGGPRWRHRQQFNLHRTPADHCSSEQPTDPRKPRCMAHHGQDNYLIIPNQIPHFCRHLARNSVWCGHVQAEGPHLSRAHLGCCHVCHSGTGLHLAHHGRLVHHRRVDGRLGGVGCLRLVLPTHRGWTRAYRRSRRGSRGVGAGRGGIRRRRRRACCEILPRRSVDFRTRALELGYDLLLVHFQLCD